jgi:hypothetical protein
MRYFSVTSMVRDTLSGLGTLLCRRSVMLAESNQPNATVNLLNPSDLTESRSEIRNASLSGDRRERQAMQLTISRMVVGRSPKPVQTANHRSFVTPGQIAQVRNPWVIPQVRAHLDPVTGHLSLPHQPEKHPE